MKTIDMDSRPKLSIIMPVYNKEEFLVASISSVLSQTFGDFELLLVNDGSSDNSLSICHSQAGSDSRIRVIDQSNAGVSAARNVGILAARGEYIGFLDSDDTIDADMYELLISNAISYKADISVCSIRIIYPRKVVEETTGPVRVRYFDRSGGIGAVLKGTLGWSANNKIYKAALAKQINFEGKVNEDLLFVFKAFTSAQVSVFQNALKYNYIKRHNSVSMTFNASQFESIEVSKKIVELTAVTSPVHLQEANYLDFASNISMLNLIILSSKSRYLNEFKAIVEYMKSFNLFVKGYPSVARKHRIAYLMLSFNPSLYSYFTTLYCRFFYSEAATKLA